MKGTAGPRNTAGAASLRTVDISLPDFSTCTPEGLLHVETHPAHLTQQAYGVLGAAGVANFLGPRERT